MRKPLLLLFLLTVAGTARAQVTVPRWLDPPTLDGKCGDPAYERGASLSGVASVVHSSTDLYLCVGKLPAGTERIAVGLDADLSAGSAPDRGDYVFRFTNTGTITAERGEPGAQPVPLPITAADASAAFAAGSAEVRISLEWLGGYARNAGLGLTVEGKGGAVLQSWPSAASPASPRSWGELALAPVYEQGTSAGSLFLDGREGYLAIPYAPELNPKELTVEAWVRAVDGDCGTLVGNGRSASYWLALCEGVRFGHAGASTVLGAGHPLGDEWHHVAATFDEEGVRTLYVDGSVVLQPGWEPAQERDEDEVPIPAVLGSSTLPLRIGSDRDDPDRDPLHGYVRELRIWDRARTIEEIRETAFVDLTGGEEGLVGLWPFTSNLEDLAGGHDAGLIGGAALAREEPRVTEFPDPPQFEPYDAPPRKPIPAWKAQVPALADGSAMKLDGDCSLAEYGRAAKLSLEPDRSYHMKLMVAGDSLWLCSNILAGKTGGASSAVTLWIDRDGKPAAQPGSSELRIRLTPDGKLAAGTGNGTGYGGAAPAGIQTKVLAGDRLRAQEDLHPFAAPWWSGEIRIPLKALAPFAPGASLRFALAYDGEVPDAAGKAQAFRERWPASFQELRSDTWGVASTSKPAALAFATSVAAQPVINSAPRVHISSELADIAKGDPPRTPPTVADFEEPCTWSLSPPLLPEPRDLAFVFDSDLKWPLVDETRPFVQVTGTLTKVYVADEDSLFIHTSHDVDMKMTLPVEADRWVTIDADANLVLETESAGFPPNNDRDLGARPSLGDHVTALGRWIFDCGHEPKTEVHPIPMFESDRLEVRPLWPGGPQRTVRMVRVWLNSDPEPFSYEFDGVFTFDVELPPAGWAPFARVVEGDPSQVLFERTDAGMKIHVDPPDRTGTYYFEMMLGHLVQPEDGLSRTSRTAMIGDWQLDVLDDHDHGFPPDCFSISAFEDCGELYFAVNVNGIWRQLLWNHQMASGQTVGILDSFTVAGPDLNLQVTGYEEDPTIPHGGGEALSPDPNTDPLIDGFDRGPLDNPLPSPLDAPGGDWRLHYNVTPGGEMPASLVDQPFWSPRLDTEPNDSTHLSLGVLPVPGPGAPAVLTSRSGFLTEPPSAYPPDGELILFDPEVDRYRFSLADFANVEVLPLPSPLLLEVESWNPWHASGSLPATLKVEIAPGVTQDRATTDVIGFAGAKLEVSSPDGRAGDRAYAVQVRTSYRELPPDWGESRDAQGRTLDLTAVTPIPPTTWFPEKRVLAADWAWQHIASDTDTYKVIVPAVAGPPAGHVSCRFDNPGRLSLRAHPMNISVRSPSRSGTGFVIVDNLLQLLPNGGTVLVDVSAPAPPRRLYRFEAEWEGTRFYTRGECDELGRQMAMIRRLTPEGELEIMKGIIALQGGRFPGQGPWPGPDPAPTELPPLGDFRVIRFEKGGPLDLVVSSPGDQPVLARLFDKSGVLVGESEGLDEATADKTPAPAGLVPHTRLQVEGLEAGDYLLQVVPRERGVERQQLTLGFDERKP